MLRRRAAAPFLLALAVLALAGCAALRRGGAESAATAIRGEVDDLDSASLALAAERTAVVLGTLPPSTLFAAEGGAVTAGDLVESARYVASVARAERDPSRLTASLSRHCRARRAGGEAKVTGYYEPVLAARRRGDRRFRFPLYRPPSDEQAAALRRRYGRMPTRAEIDGRGALAGLDLELAWVDDAVARFFLHVQGSGRLVFEDGREERVGFASSNGLSYVSVGSVMLARGLLERGNASAPAMRSWLTAHPGDRDALLAENPRYIFFRETVGEGPVGALGAALVAGRSIAVDTAQVPRGILAWLRTTRPVPGPDGRAVAKAPLARFVFAQDTGAAIRGPARVDLFVGSGEEAGLHAGLMNEDGELYLLLCGPARRRW
jgi:membrane-bound lytic murein transglycosylase A